MASFLTTILVPIAVGAVAVVRVLLQFVAIIITMLAVWAMGR
jgi:hypothetical protein